MNKYSIVLGLLVIMLNTNGQNAGLSLGEEIGFTSWNYNRAERKVFVEHKGQFDGQDLLAVSQIRYSVDNMGYKIYFTPKGLTYRLDIPDLITPEEELSFQPKIGPQKEIKKKNKRYMTTRPYTYNIEWIVANPDVKIVPEDVASEYFNYEDVENPDKTVGYARGYKKIIYKDLYPKIDVEYLFHDTAIYDVLYRPDDSGLGCTSPSGWISSTKPNIRFTSCQGPAIPYPYVYTWSPADSVSIPNIANPIAIVNVVTTYTVNVTGTKCPIKDSATVNINCAVLPINLLSFTAEKLHNQDVLLKWKTAGESNNDRFEIEASLDGLIFDKIGERKGVCTTTSQKDYTFLDNTQSENHTFIYYRLKRLDFSGNYNYSIVMALNFDIKEFVSFTPNPVKAGDNLQININAIQTGIITIRMIDTMGREV